MSAPTDPPSSSAADAGPAVTTSPSADSIRLIVQQEIRAALAGFADPSPSPSLTTTASTGKLSLYRRLCYDKVVGGLQSDGQTPCPQSASLPGRSGPARVKSNGLGYPVPESGEPMASSVYPRPQLG